MKNYEKPSLKINLFSNDEEIIASAVPPANDTPENELGNGGNEIVVPDDNFDKFN